MLQIVDDKEVYVVDLKTMPELPITWETPEEEPFAKALGAAILTGVITEPGKYGIETKTRSRLPELIDYIIFTIKE